MSVVAREECQRGALQVVGREHPFNPVRVAFHEYVALGRDLRVARSWRARWNLLLRGPGYEPER